MRWAPRQLVMLLAIAVVLSPLRAAWHGHSVAAHDGHVHLHTHAHDGVTPVHAHAHYHHHGEDGEEDQDHHDAVLDHGGPGPTTVWTAPRGTTIAAAPAARAEVAGYPVGLDMRASPLRRAKPPPGTIEAPGRLHHLALTRITILRL